MLSSPHAQGVYKWSDGSGVFYQDDASTKYAKWNDGELDNDDGVNGSEECIGLEVGAGGWNDMGCDANTRASVCMMGALIRLASLSERGNLNS